MSLRKNSIKPATKFCGAKQKLLCDRAGKSRSKAQNPADVQRQKKSTKTDCPWAITIEESSVGWVVSVPALNAVNAAMEEGNGDCLCHNHPLLVTTSERNMNSSLRDIPAESL